ncbi:MAG: D-glycero-beta-D-manno-heptose 1,7-bisphosphate 7-phosphatase [Gammaproteobacteria bacterium]|nr:D-glycero-beta-D-manno-heptose 1,7-bisphosphate 7-phosphatase [Gammaproteobacteria bacterium]
MKLVILDRDGVINEDSEDFVRSVDELRPIRGSLEAIASLCNAGYRVVVASNQSGLARGLFDIDALNDIHAHLNRLLAEIGGRIEAFFFCPHGPEAGCECRKPATGMLYDVAVRLRTTLAGVPIVGDSDRDLAAARTVGARPVLVRTGNGARTERECGAHDEIEVYDDLAAFARHLLSEH